MTTQFPSKCAGFEALLQHFPSIYSVKIVAITITNILSSAVQANFFDRDRASQHPLHMTTHQLVHTFETIEQCSTNCPRPCVMQVLEELEMMPRWICDPSQVEQNNAQHSILTKNAPSNARSLRPLLNDAGNADGGALYALSHNQFLLIIAPVACLLILCVAISLRRCNASSSMAAI
uniref:Uncharacterized protein n=1 Tax=Globodera rostochiensis TaxID=31243 RepID=A0A914I6W4_GLORO